MSRLSLTLLTSLAIAATPSKLAQNPRVLAPIKGIDAKSALTLINQLPEYWDPEDLTLVNALMEVDPEKMLSAMLRRRAISARIVLEHVQGGKIKMTAAMRKKIFNYLKKKNMFSKEDQELLNFVLENPSIPVIRELLVEHSAKLNTEQVKLCMAALAEKRGIVIVPWGVQYYHSPTTARAFAECALVQAWSWGSNQRDRVSTGTVAYNAREVLRYAHELFQTRKDLPVPPTYSSAEDESLVSHTHMWNKEGSYLLTPDHRYALATTTSSAEVVGILRDLGVAARAQNRDLFLPELEMNPNLEDIIINKNIATMVFDFCPTWPVLNVIEKKYGDYAVQLLEDPAGPWAHLDAIPSSLSKIVRYPSKGLVKRLSPSSKMYWYKSSAALIKATLRVYSEGIQSDDKATWSAVEDLLKSWDGTHEELLDTVAALT